LVKVFSRTGSGLLISDFFVELKIENKTNSKNHRKKHEKKTGQKNSENTVLLELMFNQQNC